MHRVHWRVTYQISLAPLYCSAGAPRALASIASLHSSYCGGGREGEGGREREEGFKKCVEGEVLQERLEGKV